MKIQFTRSGGFAGPAMKQNLTLDTNDLSAAEANELTNLVKQANLPALSGETEGTTPRPDEFHYRISVEDEGQNQSVRTSDSAMPETLGPLIDWLSERATR
jgi:hypothetical protein